ncbi:MAG: DnaJ domain-containing protein [Vicinamibacteria bacterium]|nr:DnaJ domain-containing protein [Vicinamibacteria bacterium]
MPDYYQLLGVRPDASPAEIRSAYLRLARDRHPDRHTDPAEKAHAEESFREITTAFNTLSNERSRREYDDELARPKATTPEELAQEAYLQGIERLKAQDHQEALGFFRAAVHHLPERAEYQVALGRVLAMNPSLGHEAVTVFEKAATLEPQNAQIYVELARILHNQGLRIRARRAVEAALRLAPHDPDVARILAGLGMRPDKGGAAAPRGSGLLDRLRGKS